jgi:hypothetical protein
MRVAFLKVGEYEGTLRHFKALAGRFKEEGAKVLELDIGQGDLNERVKELMEFGPMFCVDLNASGACPVGCHGLCACFHLCGRTSF